MNTKKCLQHCKILLLHNINDAMQIGTLLRKLRDNKKLSSREIADKIDVAHSTYMDWEHDKTSPSLKSYAKLSHALNVNPLEFMAYLTGNAPDLMSSEEKGNITDLSEVVKFYQKQNDLLKEEKASIEEELEKVKENMKQH